MDIALYSNDPELHALCMHVARLTPGTHCSLRNDFKTPPASPAEICIYDTTLGPIEELPDHNGVRSGILIVGRAELQQIRTKMLHLRTIILLRPVNRARLEIAIEQTLSQPMYTVDCNLMRLNRDELLECLLHANLRLQEYDQDRSQFLARAIHELRAPLTSLNGYCGMLLGGKLGSLSNEQLGVLARMRRSVERLGRIASSTYDLSAGRSCESEPDFQVGNIIECVEQALHEIEPSLRDRRIQLEVKFLPATDVLCFDGEHMVQVFLNLLDNCCKFTGRGGFIRVNGYPYRWEGGMDARFHQASNPRAGEVDAQFNSYRIDIADNGPGIPPERLERTFAESTIYGGGSDRSGAGLGLAIARMFVREHKGTIWAESKSAQGTTFCVVLPHCTEEDVVRNSTTRPAR